MRLLLWPLAYTLRYCGMDVLEPVLLHGVHGYHKWTKRAVLEARLTAALADQAWVLRDLDRRPVMAFNPDSDFDAEGRLRADAPSHSPFIRRPD